MTTVSLGNLQIPIFVHKRSQDLQRSDDLILSSLYGGHNSSLCVMVPQELSAMIRSCMWNSGQQGTPFMYTLQFVDLQPVSSEVKNNMLNIRTTHTLVQVFVSLPTFANLPVVSGPRALHEHCRLMRIGRTQDYVPHIITLQINIPRRHVISGTPWQCSEHIRANLEKLIFYSSSVENRRNFRNIYTRMNTALTIYNQSERAPTLSQKFLTAVSNTTKIYDQEVDQPEGLNIELRPHQRKSLKFCLDRENCPDEKLCIRVGEFMSTRYGPQEIYYSPVLKYFSTTEIKPVHSGMIFDEMGLGKTAVTLALHLANPPPEEEQVGGTLVVCPPSLVHQWVAEARKTLQSDNEMYIFHGPRRCRDVDFLMNQKLVVTTYGIVHSESRYNDGVSCMERVKWHRIVFDESHVIRNASTGSYKACRRLQANHRWICTGTPFVSTVDDIPNQLNLISDYSIRFRSNDYYGSMKRFVYIILSMAIRHTTDMKIGGVPLLDLQDVVRTEVPLEWDSQAEIDKYKEEEAIVFHNVQTVSTGVALSQVSKLLKRCAIGFHSNMSFDRRRSGFLIMTEEEKTYTEENVGDCPICMEPIELCNSAIVRSCKHLFCAVCIQTHIQHGAHACPLCRGRLSQNNVCIPPLIASTTEDTFENSRSPKVEKLLNLITGSDPDDKILIFSSYKDVILYTKQRLEDESIPCFAFLPGMSLNNRRRGLEQFQEDASLKVLILPMRTSSSGLNITAANKIIILEPTLHKNTERQAIGRAWRMGQQRQVTVHYLYMKNTVEEKIHEINKITQSDHIDSRWNYQRILQLFQ